MNCYDIISYVIFYVLFVEKLISSFKLMHLYRGMSFQQKAKMEAGLNPARSRHCDRGATFHGVSHPLVIILGRRNDASILKPGDMHEVASTARIS